jgi:hypothetical protein
MRPFSLIQCDLRHILLLGIRRQRSRFRNRLFERKHEMGVNGATDIVTNANPPPKNPDTVSSKDVQEFKEAVDRSTTSSNSSQPSQGTSNSSPIILATRPPINFAPSTGNQGGSSQAGAPPAAAAKAPAAATQTVPGTSTPLPKDAVVDKKTKVATLQSGDFTVKVEPDKKDANKGEDKKLDVKSDGAVTHGDIRAQVSFKTVNGKVTSVSIKKELDVKTTYGSKADPAANSAYGRGHIKTDKDAGNGSLRFHEGNHGQDYIDYVKTHPYPTVEIDKPITKQEFDTRMSEWKKQAEQYQKDMEAQSKQHTDDITDPPPATTPTPAATKPAPVK